MQVAVGAISHETNTFADGRTGLETFSTTTGADLLTTEHVGRSIRGIVDELERADVDILPTVGASALPAPTVEASAFEWMRDELVSRLDGEPVDGVCLDLHGSRYIDGD
ncbi:M81 family metallopeptidase, partial [Haladaptatus sp.]|uniref:M81 family metallopeptidase n=1 Tax=Haladaptatus sp. TaxID=1973141 RepID=UPI003C337E9F